MRFFAAARETVEMAKTYRRFGASAASQPSASVVEHVFRGRA